MFINDIRCCMDAIKHGRAATLKGVMWPTREIRVFYMDGAWEMQRRVAQIARQWSDISGVAFIPAKSRGESDVRVTFAPGGSWSFLGIQAKDIPYNKPTMQLGWANEDTEQEELEQVVLHEFGHVMGLIHEHQNPSGGILWDFDRVMAYYTGYPNYWSRSEVEQNVFRKYSNDNTQFGVFDPNSIMLYPIPAAFTRNGFEVGFNSKLSDLDKAFVKELYKA